MPATAGRVRMPVNNRVHSSAALQTHGIWTAMGYDPYAPINDGPNKSVKTQSDAENPYLNFQGLMALARASNSDDVARGACKKCGRVGHLTFQCRNFLGIKEKEPVVVSSLDQTLKDKDVYEGGKEEEESESSDSDVDSEFERIITERYTKKSIRHRKTARKNREESDSVSDSDSDSVRKKKRRRSKRNARRETSDSEDDEEVRRKRRRKRDDERRRYERKSRKEKRTSRR